VNFELEQDYSLDDNFYVNFVDQSTGTSTSATQGATLCDWFVDYTVEDNSVEITTVTATITGVKAGAAIGSTKVTTDDTTYTVSIKDWYDCDDVFSYASAPVLQTTDTFVGGKTYTVGVTFTPVGDNTLASSLTASINGEPGKIGGFEGNSRNYFITISVPVFKPSTYTVTFDSVGGSAVTAQTIEEGQNASRPADPTKDGFDFKGWTLNGSAYDFNTAVSGNITLVAAWEQQEVPIEKYTPGDVTGDGKVNMADVVAIRRYLVNASKYPLNVEAAGDVTGDGKINMADVVKIRRYLVNSEVYPLG
jgi:uncharacterized repeat protein (TIGR02543 family)